MRITMNNLMNCKLLLAALLLLVGRAVPGEPLARQCGTVGVVTYDPLPDPTSPEAYTRTTDIPVPYAWLLANWPDTVDEYASYEAAASMTAANGCRTVGECYALGIDPEDPKDDFRITSFEMVGGKPVMTFSHTEDGSGNSFEPRMRTLGAKSLGTAVQWDDMAEIADPEAAGYRFFKVEVEMP